MWYPPFYYLLWLSPVRCLKYRLTQKLKAFTVENQFIMEMKTLVTFIRHESALLYAISALKIF